MRSCKKKEEESCAQDDVVEMDIVKRILDIVGNNGGVMRNASITTTSTNGIDDNMNSSGTTGSNSNNNKHHHRTNSNSTTGIVTTEELIQNVHLCNKALSITSDRVGRWNDKVALSIMEAVGVQDAEVRVEETTRDLRYVRKYALGLRENVERCAEAVHLLSHVVLNDDDTTGGEKKEGEKFKNTNDPSFAQLQTIKLKESRQNFLSALASVFSSVMLLPDDEQTCYKSKKQQSKSALPSTSVLTSVGIDTSDPAGWSSAVKGYTPTSIQSYRNPQSIQKRHSGEVALEYQKVRDKDVAVLLSRIAKLLLDYEKRVEEIESFVYMHCVGIQLEKHFSNLRSKALAAWEKKTDITTAINIATKKRLPLVVKELQSKLESLSPHVSHTTVKHAKEKHLASKNLKNELQSLADRRFQRLKETATERVIAIMAMWAQHEENNARRELEALGETIREIERAVTEEHIEADGGAHLFAAKASGSAAASLATASRR